MTTTQRPLGALATILDADALLQIGRRAFATLYPDHDAQTLSHGPTPQMMLPVNHGETAIINREGVGNIADENNTVVVWFTCLYELLPIAIPLSEIANTVTDQKIDLALGIRTFGSRLDANHHIWYRKYDNAAS